MQTGQIDLFPVSGFQFTVFHFLSVLLRFFSLSA